jgi:IS30 family transposase
LSQHLFHQEGVVGGRRVPVEVRRWALDLLSQGHNPMEVSRRTGVSKTYLYELHHRVGGVYRPPSAVYSDRYLDREERYEIARLHEAGWSIRKIAGRLGRSPSTISRELRRNHEPRSGTYIPERAHRLAWERQRRPKASKLGRDPALREQVQTMLDNRYSPDQISGRLHVLFPDNEQMRVSHETIYQSLYVYPRGELKRELQGHLRTRRSTRKRRGRIDRRGKLPDPVSIRERPEEVAERLVPGHHEGDLLMGSKASNSAVGTIVERVTGYLTVLHLPDGHSAVQVADAIVEQMTALPPWFAKTLTWDRGIEMAKHHTITSRTGISVYFADPYSPYQRGTNENTNGLLREYLPKSTDLSIHSAADLQAIQDELNDRPRKRLGYLTPREALDNLLRAELASVATTT